MGDRASGRNFFQQHSPERAQVVVSLNPGDETRNDRERHRFHDLAEVGLAGIGVFLEQRGRERYCVVNSLQKRGSAEREGTLRIGDALITVDGKDTTGYDMENVRGTLMGRCGSLVCLGIRPRGAADGVEVQEVMLKRGTLEWWALHEELLATEDQLGAASEQVQEIRHMWLAEATRVSTLQNQNKALEIEAQGLREALGTTLQSLIVSEKTLSQEVLRRTEARDKTVTMVADLEGRLANTEDAVHAAERARDSAERSATARVHEAETRCQEAVAGRALLDQELLTRAARADAEAGDAKLKLQEVEDRYTSSRDDQVAVIKEERKRRAAGEADRDASDLRLKEALARLGDAVRESKLSAQEAQHQQDMAAQADERFKEARKKVVELENALVDSQAEVAHEAAQADSLRQRMLTVSHERHAAKAAEMHRALTMARDEAADAQSRIIALEGAARHEREEGAALAAQLSQVVETLATGERTRNQLLGQLAMVKTTAEREAVRAAREEEQRVAAELAFRQTRHANGALEQELAALRATAQQEGAALRAAAQEEGAALRAAAEQEVAMLRAAGEESARESREEGRVRERALVDDNCSAHEKGAAAEARADAAERGKAATEAISKRLEDEVRALLERLTTAEEKGSKWAEEARVAEAHNQSILREAEAEKHEKVTSLRQAEVEKVTSLRQAEADTLARTREVEAEMNDRIGEVRAEADAERRKLREEAHRELQDRELQLRAEGQRELQQALQNASADAEEALHQARAVAEASSAEKARVAAGALEEALERARVEAGASSADFSAKIAALEAEVLALQTDSAGAEALRRSHTANEEGEARQARVAAASALQRALDLERALAKAHEVFEEMRQRLERLEHEKAESEHNAGHSLENANLQIKVVGAERDRLKGELERINPASESPVGIGVKLASHGSKGGVRILDLVKGLSADLSDAIFPGDFLLEVDGKSVDRHPLDDIRRWTSGPRGSKVAIVIEHEGKPRRMTLRRGAFGAEHSVVEQEELDMYPHAASGASPPPTTTPPRRHSGAMLPPQPNSGGGGAPNAATPARTARGGANAGSISPPAGVGASNGAGPPLPALWAGAASVSGLSAVRLSAGSSPPPSGGGRPVSSPPTAAGGDAAQHQHQQQQQQQQPRQQQEQQQQHQQHQHQEHASHSAAAFWMNG